MNRRQFLQTTAGAAAASATRPLLARAQSGGVVGANERVRLAIIGSGGRGNQVLTSFSQVPNNIFVAACDVFKERVESTVQRLSTAGNRVDAYEDYRRVLDRKDIDAVLIATPDHWHPQLTIDACDAGKDVYLEKPTSNSATVDTAVRMIDVVGKTKRIVQVGTQQRSWPHFDEARGLLPQLGGVTHVMLQYGGGSSPVAEPVVPAPAGPELGLVPGTRATQALQNWTAAAMALLLGLRRRTGHRLGSPSDRHGPLVHGCTAKGAEAQHRCGTVRQRAES